MTDAEARITALYGVPASEFVAAREALARELRAEGRADLAADVHALRRPTVVAWSLNQLAHAPAARIAALVTASAEVLDAQPRAAEGSAADLRDANRRRRGLLDELTDAAAALTGNPAAHRAAIEATLDGASLDPELQPVLMAGRLTKELPPRARFPVGDALAATPPGAAARRPAKRATVPARDDLARRRAQQALEQARARAEAAERSARDAAETVEEAQRELEDATGRVAELERALASAREALRSARRTVAESRRAESAAQSARQRAAASLRLAEQASPPHDQDGRGPARSTNA